MSDGTRSTMGIKVIAAVVIGILIIGVLAFVTRDQGERAEDTGVTDQLNKAGYKMTDGSTVDDADLKRKVTTQQWERDASPQRIIISDKSSYTTPGILVLAEIAFTDGELATCRPNSEYERSPLEVVIEDAQKVRAGMSDGSVKPAQVDNPDFPFIGVAVSCKL